MRNDRNARQTAVRNPAKHAGVAASILRRRSIVVAGVAIAVVFGALAVLRDGDRLATASLHPRAEPLLMASAMEVGLLAWMVFLWQKILTQFDGASLTYRALLLIWRRSTLAKYLPGSVWSAAAAAEMAGELGGSATTLAASFVLQAAFTIVGALIVARGFGHAAPAWQSLAAVAGGLCFTHPKLINAVLRLVQKVTRRPVAFWHGGWSVGLCLLVLHIATWTAFGGAFAVFVHAVAPDLRVPISSLIAINAFVFSAGFLAFFAPGGIGVREGALVLALAPFVPAMGTRVMIAAASRLWLVFTELAHGTLIQVVPSTRRRARTAQRHQPRPPIINTGEAVEIFADSAQALPRIIAAFRAAQQSIAIAQLAFDADCRPVRGSDDGNTPTLLDVLAEAADSVDVRVLLNGGLLLDTSPALRRALAELRAERRIHLRTIKAFPQMMHAKLIVIDEREAFLMGASFVNGYWDGARHVAKNDPSAPPGTGDRPLHDVAIHLSGHGAAALATWFESFWRHADAGDPSSYAPSAEPAALPALPLRPSSRGPSNVGRSAVRILRTAPPEYSEAPNGDEEILAAYLDAISRARSFIYLESQYFSSRRIAGAVRNALDANDRLEVVLLLNQNPDITAYRRWQDARLAEQRLLDHPRVGVFSLWSTTPSHDRPARTEITQVFIHSKVALVDDDWATIGTANLDGASLHSYGDDFTSRIGRAVFGRYRNIDLNVELLDGCGGEPSTGVTRTFRAELWARHLGLDHGELMTRPASGWLDVWRRAAMANAASLRSSTSGLARGRVLPYVPNARPRRQLRALGVDLEKSALDLRFDPGTIEVLFSPGWMKRLLPERLRA